MSSTASDADQSLRPTPTVFVSHMTGDLTDYVEPLRHALRQAGASPLFANTEIDPLPGHALASWREAIAEGMKKAQCVLLIVGWQYGLVPSGQTHCVTHLEYIQAKHLGIPRLIFLANRALLRRPTLPPPPEMPPSKLPPVFAFRRELASENPCIYFGSPPDLADKVAFALSQFQRTLTRSIRIEVPLVDLDSLRHQEEPPMSPERDETDTTHEIDQAMTTSVYRPSAPDLSPEDLAGMFQRWKIRMQAESAPPQDPPGQPVDEPFLATSSHTVDDIAMGVRKPSSPDSLADLASAARNRQDVEQLLRLHGGGLGPVYWSDKNHWDRPGLDLRAADLRRADLHGLPLARLRATLLSDADLHDAHLERADLGGAHLERANLRGAHLEGAYLEGAHLEGADLSGAYLESADLSRAHVDCATLRGAHLQETLFLGATLTGAHFDSGLGSDEAIFGEDIEDGQESEDAALRFPASVVDFFRSQWEPVLLARESASPRATIPLRDLSASAEPDTAEVVRGIPLREAWVNSNPGMSSSAREPQETARRQASEPSRHHEPREDRRQMPTELQQRLQVLLRTYTAALVSPESIYFPPDTVRRRSVRSERSVDLWTVTLHLHAVQQLVDSLEAVHDALIDGNTSASEALQTARTHTRLAVATLRPGATTLRPSFLGFRHQAGAPGVQEELTRLLTVAERLAYELTVLQQDLVFEQEQSLVTPSDERHEARQGEQRAERQDVHQDSGHKETLVLPTRQGGVPLSPRQSAKRAKLARSRQLAKARRRTVTREAPLHHHALANHNGPGDALFPGAPGS